jgi:hypothetical protein
MVQERFVPEITLEFHTELQDYDKVSIRVPFVEISQKQVLMCRGLASQERLNRHYPFPHAFVKFIGLPSIENSL